MFLSDRQIKEYQNDGVIIIKDVFKDWIEPLRKGFQKVLDNPSKHGRENVTDDNGRFFEDYCNWERIEEFKDCLFNSPGAQIVSEATNSKFIQIFHEHFASERLHDFLTTIWRPLSDRSRGPSVICAALPGENHLLGLHMAATIVALYGFRIIFLGPKTPLKDLIACSWQSDAKAILISISSTSNKENMKNMAVELITSLPNSQIVLGGQGAPYLENSLTMKSLSELATWSIQNFKKFRSFS
mgnify:CR=1 FL=1